MTPLVLTPGVPFFLSARRTMKKSYLLFALVLAIIAAFVFLMVRLDPLQQKIASDIQKVNARFTPDASVDLAMAMKIITHAPPQMLNPPAEVPPLLVFPPTPEDLAKLSGV